MAGTDAKEDEKPEDDKDESGARARLERLLPDIVKRTFYAGLGAVFTTEEGIRKIASDFHLPKDVANYLIQQAASSKEELQKLLTSLSFEIKTEVRFIPNDEAVGGVKPDVKRDVSVKRVKKDKDGDG
jgi:hypothetical protein